jgi:hypothetical protein
MISSYSYDLPLFQMMHNCSFSASPPVLSWRRGSYFTNLSLISNDDVLAVCLAPRLPSSPEGRGSYFTNLSLISK